MGRKAIERPLVPNREKKMDQNIIENKILEIIQVQAGRITTDEINLDGNFEDVGLDSLDVIEVIITVEEEFNIEIDEPVEKTWKTLRDFAIYVNTVKRNTNISVYPCAK